MASKIPNLKEVRKHDLLYSYTSLNEVTLYKVTHITPTEIHTREKVKFGKDGRARTRRESAFSIRLPGYARLFTCSAMKKLRKEKSLVIINRGYLQDLWYCPGF